MEKESLWQAVLAQIQLNISEANFATWFKNTKILEKRREGIVVSAPNSFVKEWIEVKYKKSILRILHSLDREIKKIDFTIGKAQRQPEKAFPHPSDEQLRFGELQKDRKTNLNHRYTFESFVVGGFNELAHAASWAVSENPGIVYNPLFVYGRVGLGKTHLLQAVGNQTVKNFPQKETRYIPAERFTSEVISSIRNRTIEVFKKAHCKIDVLIIDDVQFLAGKEKTQEEFFNIFNDLYQKNKQIILSSDRPPKAIPALAERLRSRFEGGMIADISYPDLETRIAILKSKAQEKNINFSEEIFHLLASTIQTNIRELEGALSRLVLHQKLHNKPPAHKEVEDILKEITFSPLQKTTPKKIIKTVAEFYDLQEKELVSNSRKKEIVRPRQIAMYLLKQEVQGSYPFIAKTFGGKDHTTVIYAVKKILKEVEKNEGLERDINLIKIRLSNP